MADIGQTPDIGQPVNQQHGIFPSVVAQLISLSNVLMLSAGE